MAKPPPWDWNDVRCFLAVLREGSTLRAAAKLGIDQTTCARRIAALEDALGVTLFERSATGYAATPAALSLREAAEEMESVAGRFAVMADAETRRTKKALRVTASPSFADAVAATVAQFREKAPGAVVEVDFSDTVRDLVSGEADLAVRGGFQPEQPGLVVRRLWSEGNAIYCSADYAKRFGVPTPADLTRHPLVMLSGKALDMSKANGLGPSIAQVVNSMDGLVAAIRSGAFVGFLTDFWANAEPDLIKCFEIPAQELGAWIAFPERWRQDADHRALRELLAIAIADIAKKRPEPGTP